MTDDLPPNAVYAETRDDWRAWLTENHTRTDGIWLTTNKKSSGGPHLSYAESVEEALCFGWVDSKGRKLDDRRTMLWFAPRRAGSGWSRPNKERIARMTAEGKMTAAGRAKIEAAKQDGSWTLLDAVEELTVPEDLAAALAAAPPAPENWDAFPRSAKRGILEWIRQSKTAATRTRRVTETARLAAENRRANQWRPKAEGADSA